MRIASKILIAYDGSNLSDKALRKVKHIVEEDPEIEVTIVNVLDLTLTLANSYMFEEVIKEMRKISHELLVKAKTAFNGLKNPVTTHTLEGSPGREISGFAKGNRFDLVVMGSRGLNDFKELFLGSVSHYVIQHVYCPVLIIK